MWCLFFLFFSNSIGIFQDSGENINSKSDMHGTLYFTTYSSVDYGGRDLILDVKQKSNGSLIFASVHELIEYDGHEWNRHPQSTFAHISDLGFQFGETENTIYVGMHGDILKYEKNIDGTFNIRNLTELIPENYREFYQPISQAWHNERFWIAYDNFTIIYDEKSDSISVLESIEYMFDGKIYTSKLDKLINFQDQLFVTTEFNHLIRINSLTDAEYVQNLGFTVTDYVEFKNELYFISTDGIHILKDNQTENLKTSSTTWLSKSPKDIVFFNDGRFAISTNFLGTFIFDPEGELLHWLGINSGLPTNEHHKLLIDRDQNLWISTVSGIIQVYTGLYFTHFRSSEFDIGDILDIQEFNGELFLATSTGVFKKKRNTKNLYEIDPSDVFINIGTIEQSYFDLHETQGELLISSRSGIYKLNGDQLDIISENESARYLTSHHSNKILYYTKSEGVGYLLWDERINEWVSGGEIPEITYQVYGMRMLDNGLLLLGTYQDGFYTVQWDQNSKNFDVNHYNLDDGLPVSSYYSPELWDDNYIVFANDGFYRKTIDGKFIFDDQMKSVYDKNEILYSEFIRKDKNENYWMLSLQQNNIIVSHLINNDNQFNHYQTPMKVLRHGFSDFLELNDNRLWVGSEVSVINFDIDRFEDLTVPKNVQITQIVDIADNKTIKSIPNIPDEIKLNSDLRNIRIQFSLMSFQEPERTAYSYRINNESWSNWRNENWLDLIQHNPGTYLIDIRAIDFMDRMGEPVSIKLILLPPWYLSLYAYLFYISIGLLSTVYFVRAYGSYKVNLQEQKHQTLNLERDIIRQKLADDFHDEIGNRITRLGLLINRLNPDQPENLELIKKLEQNIGQLFDETRDFIWQIDPGKDTLLDIYSRLQHFGNEFFEVSTINFIAHPIESALHQFTFDIKSKTHILRFFKEAINNIQKHSFANEVSFTVYRIDQFICFSLKDDGIGLNENQIESSGKGINSMKNRSELLKGKFEIISEQNNGTQIKFYVPISISNKKV